MGGKEGRECIDGPCACRGAGGIPDGPEGESSRIFGGLGMS